MHIGCLDILTFRQFILSTTSKSTAVSSVTDHPTATDNKMLRNSREAHK